MGDEALAFNLCSSRRLSKDGAFLSSFVFALAKSDQLPESYLPCHPGVALSSNENGTALPCHCQFFNEIQGGAFVFISFLKLSSF